ncbi:MAG TPA: DUF1906 domain-containing protein [Streptosporangiaceae bacterium]|nr:DUF1906 domain-containing protein [Streptosporangiaceae bacterium]
MRRAVMLAAVLGSVAAAGSADVLASTDSTAESGTRSIDYAGMRIEVPKDWPVYRLDLDSAQCMRYDRPAVYLGGADPDQQCPARLIGGAPTLQVGPDGVTTTGTSDERRELLGRVRMLGPMGPRAVRGPAAPPAVGGPAGTAHRWHAGWTVGSGFDNCSAPPRATMKAWRAAYSVTSVYIGGESRGCAQPNLTRAWVRAVRLRGWRLIPTYVGPQAPCTGFHNRFTARDAYAQGARAADDAVASARALGIEQRAPIYYDMEAYSGNERCRAAVLTFLRSWAHRLRQRSQVSGVYSSAGSAIHDLVGVHRKKAKPSAIWFAHWDGKARTQGDSYVPDRRWSPHRRIKQYLGEHRETHGGIGMTVDRNVVDGRVY